VSGFSDYIVYMDESGDHGLASIDPDYPVFVLVFCIYRKEDYANFVPQLQRLKFRYFGHDMVVLHEHEIRKAQPPFAFLVNRAKRENFMSDLARLVEEAPFTLLAVSILKRQLVRRYALPANPYHLALAFGLERVWYFLRAQGQDAFKTFVVAESRGKKENNDLELEFRRVCQGANSVGNNLPFEMVFANKQTNSCGLQVADLVARPVGRHLIDPTQPNRAWGIIERKFRRSPEGRLEGWGLKVFP
jgi:hypothetical protein